MMSKHLRVALALGAVLLAAGILEARTRKGDKFFKDAQAAENKKDWDTAVDLYQQAADEDPKDSGYLIAMRRARFQGAQVHVGRGQKARAEGNVAGAMAEFQKAVVMDPSSGIALQE